MARLIPLLPAPRGNLPVPFAPLPPSHGGVAALPASRAKPLPPAPRQDDPRSALRRRVSRFVCDQYRPGRQESERGVLCDFST